MYKYIKLSFLLCIILMLTGCGNSEYTEVKKSFISTKLDSTINKKVQFNEIKIANKNDTDTGIIIYTNIGQLVFDTDSLKLVESVNYLRSIGSYTEHSNTISFESEYSSGELKAKLFPADELSWYDTDVQQLVLYAKDTISETQYESDILDIVTNKNTTLREQYFENGVISNEIVDYINDTIGTEGKVRVITGKSDSSVNYVDRVCILGISSSESVDIDLKVILKLNHKQKVYDIDII